MLLFPKNEIIIKKNLSKYNESINRYSIWKINNLIFHKKCHFSSIFIEYLVIDDIQEFFSELYPKIYSYINIPFFSNILNSTTNFPFILEEFGRNLILKNIKKKKLLLYTYLIEKKKKMIDNSNHIYKKYSNLLPKDLSDINLDMEKNEKNKVSIGKQIKDISESESTIDNVNANNDITLSIDLKINKKYDNQILKQNIEFIKNKDGKNDEEILKIINNLTLKIKDTDEEEKKNNNNSKLIYLDYINNKKIISKNKNNFFNENNKKKKNIFETNNRIISINNKSKERNIKNKKNENNYFIFGKNNDINDITTNSTNVNSYNTSLRCLSKKKNKCEKERNKNLEEIINLESYSEKILITSENENKVSIILSKENINKNFYSPKISINNTKIIRLKKSKEKYDNKKKEIIKNMKKIEINSKCIEYSPKNKRQFFIYKNENENLLGKNSATKDDKSLQKKTSKNIGNKYSYNRKEQKKNKNLTIINSIKQY